MDTSMVSDLMREMVSVAIKLGGPVLLLSMLVGVIVALFQAVTQIHEQTLNFVLKLAVVGAVLLLRGHWMLTTLQDFLKDVFQLFTL